MQNRDPKWREGWTVDLSTCTATHKTGLIVEFKLSDDKTGAWDGTSPNASEWLAIDPEHHREIAPGLMSEAGDIYKEHLDSRQ